MSDGYTEVNGLDLTYIPSISAFSKLFTGSNRNVLTNTVFEGHELAS